MRYVTLAVDSAIKKGSLRVSSHALEKASILAPFPLLQHPLRLAENDTGYFHVSEAATLSLSETQRIALRSRGTSLSFASEDRIFALTRHFARLVVGSCLERKSKIPESAYALIERHRAATEFLLMHDFAGPIRPLVDVLSLHEQRGYDSLRLPAVEFVARRALAEIEALSFESSAPPAPGKVPSGPYRHCVDAGGTWNMPSNLRADVLIPPAKGNKPPVQGFGRIRSFAFLRSAGVPPFLSALLAPTLRKLLGGRLVGIVSHGTSDTDFCIEPLLYWTNFSLRSVFHASERHARGLKNIAVATILITPTQRYYCDVFDAIISVGTGQTHGMSSAYRSGEIAKPSSQSQSSRILIALQPHDEILASLAQAAGALAPRVEKITVRPHPKHLSHPETLSNWEIMTCGKFPVAGGSAPDAKPPDLLVTGTSNFAIHAALAGIPVILVGSKNALTSIWGPDLPPPGLVVQDLELLDANTYFSLLEKAIRATNCFVDHYFDLPSWRGFIDKP